MNLVEQYEKEVELAIKNADEYVASCYRSALKAFKSLCEDNHSGMSIGITKSILIRMISCQCLTPIKDVEDEWSFVFDNEDGSKEYQNKRMSSLFKKVKPDGTVSYHDNNREVGFEDEHDFGFHGGRVSRVIDTLYPISMPYMPATEPYKAFFHSCEDEWPYKIVTPELDVITGDIKAMVESAVNKEDN